MRVTSGDIQRITRIGYRMARRGGGSVHELLPVERVLVDTLPAGCDAVLVASDLQGVASPPSGGPEVLLGLVLADYLKVWADEGLIPDPGRLGVLLAGDLYSAPNADIRGATGDVTDVWRAFTDAGCAWTAGVFGNHDVVAAPHVLPASLLDGDGGVFGGLRVAGVSGVIGDAWRADRRAEDDFLDALDAALDPRPDVLLLHEGPDGARRGQTGSTVVRERLLRYPPPLTICGHVHWGYPLARFGTGHILNVDSRVVLLTTR